MERTPIETADGLTLNAARQAASDSDGGAVLLVHGITQDMHEGGMYDRLADELSRAGFGVFRFTFRGPGAATEPTSA